MPCAIDGGKNLSGGTITAIPLEALASLGLFGITWYLPGGSNFPNVPGCPDTHVFLLYPTDKSKHTVALPARYWAIIVPLAGLPETYSSVTELACTAAEADRFVNSATFDSHYDALLIATTDPSAEPFVLTLY